MLSRTTVSVLFCMAWASCTEAPRSTFPATHAPELKSLPLRSDLIGSSSLQFTDDGGDSIFVKCVGETCSTGRRPVRTDIDPEIARAERESRPSRSREIQLADGDTKQQVRDFATIEATKSGSQTPVSMSIWLREDDWDASQLRGADAFTRRQLIEARQAAIAPSQDEVAGLVHELGGHPLCQHE